MDGDPCFDLFAFPNYFQKWKKLKVQWWILHNVLFSSMFILNSMISTRNIRSDFGVTHQKWGVVTSEELETKYLLIKLPNIASLSSCHYSTQSCSHVHVEIYAHKCLMMPLCIRSWVDLNKLGRWTPIFDHTAANRITTSLIISMLSTWTLVQRRSCMCAQKFMKICARLLPNDTPNAPDSGWIYMNMWGSR
jgi:hypothetical protein